MDVNGLVAGKLESFGAPTLEGLEFQQSSTPGVYELKNDTSRQMVRFYWKEFYNAARTKEAGSPVYEKKLMVLIVTPGEKTDYDGLCEDHHKRVYFKQYRAFMEGRTAPEGQSLEDWEIVTAPEALELKRLNVITVEQLADASTFVCEQLPRGHELKEHARAWVKAMRGKGLVDATKKLSGEVSELRDANAGLVKTLEDYQREMASMRAEIKAMQDTQMNQLIVETETKPSKGKK